MTRIQTHLTILVGALVVATALPAVALGAKPMPEGGGTGGSGSSLEKSGDNLAAELSGSLDQLLIVGVGVFGLAAFLSRSIGQAMMIVVGGMFAGLFIIAPTAAMDLFKGIYLSVF